MDMFEEINKTKKELPRIKTIKSSILSYNYNFYEKAAMIIFFICFVMGIVLGNLFPACGTSSTIYADVCDNTVFNFSLTLIIWFISFILCMFIFGLGHIIYILNEINKKMK